MKPIAMFFSALVSLFYVRPAYAIDWAAEKCSKDGVATILGIRCVILSLIGALTPIVILAALIMVLFAASKFILAGNDSKKFASAKSTLSMAIVGIVGLSIAWLLLVLIQNLTGAQVTQF